MADGEQLDIDFGDPELNDPQYEEKQSALESTDGAATQQTPDGAAQQGSGEGTDAQQQTDAKQDGTDAGKGGTPDGTGQQQQSDGDKAASARAKADKDGNLIDGAGNIIAKAGSERRAFERVQAQERVIKRSESEIERLNTELAQARALNDAPQKLGLDAQEVQMGLSAIASFKKDPVATARWMLQETMRLGYNLQQIVGADAKGQLNGGSLDLAAVKSMIAEQMQPLIGDRQAAQQNEQATQAARDEYDKFMANHDNAGVHEDAIAALVSQDRNLTPEVAYWRLREYAAANGYDFAKPLGPQVQAKQQGGGQAAAPNGNANPQTQTHQQQPMPNGGAPTRDMQQGPTMADADDAWDNIVNQSLREAGMMN